MNPMTNTKNIKKLSEQELKTNFKTSWHDQYKDSAWIFVGGLPYDLTEGDIICVFSQYGEIVNLNLVRDKITGKQKGFCFICYEDQRSTVLSVDNLNGIKILNRTIRVDHVAEYKVPKDHKNLDEDKRKIQNEGCAPTVAGYDKKPQLPIPKQEPILTSRDDISFDDIKLPERLPIGIKVENEKTSDDKVKVKKEKKSKKDKKSKKKKTKKKHKRKSNSSESSSDSDSTSSDSDSDPDRRKRKSSDKKRRNVLKSIYK